MVINKYLKRGFVLLLAGILFNLAGYLIMGNEWEIGDWKVKYGWAMVIGVVLFGTGFLYIFYGLIRKVERKAILEERSERIASENEDESN